MTNYRVEFNSHPDFEAESEKLAATIDIINEALKSIRSMTPATAAYQEAANEIQRIFESDRSKLQESLSSPYFARIDYRRLDQDSCKSDGLPGSNRINYLGQWHLPGSNVFGWESPIGALFYSDEVNGGYEALRGHIPTEVDLKRLLQVTRQRLIAITDQFIRQGIGVNPRPGTMTAQLMETLIGNSDGQLKVIIQTIRSDQYGLIANDKHKVMVVQGAAGSGKSEVALHRIAFLLSPHSEVTGIDKPTPATTLFIGPTDSFLTYADNILPNLHVKIGVERTTLNTWLRSKGTVAFKNKKVGVMEELFTKGEVDGAIAAGERFKGTMRMAALLDRYQRKLIKEIRQKMVGIPNLNIRSGRGRYVTLESLEIQNEIKPRLASDVRNFHINQERRDMVGNLTRLMRRKAGSATIGLSANGISDTELNREVSRHVHSIWKEFNFMELYVKLLNSTELLFELGGSYMDYVLANVLVETAPDPDRNEFEDSDRGPLIYFDNLLNGTIQKRYRHIIVDEAQDTTPIEFELLNLSSQNGAFTILGDISQRLTPLRGVFKWRDLKSLFGRDEIRLVYARTSIRSTKQITRFSNRILRCYDKNIPAPVPVERDGKWPTYHRSQSMADMFKAVLSEIKRFREGAGGSNSTLGVLSRTGRHHMPDFLRYCKESGVDDAAKLGKEGIIPGKIMVGQIAATKGLEFDAVFLIGLNRTFTDTEFNQRLLYLGCSRAKHLLQLHWAGAETNILKRISRRGISTTRR